MMSDDEWERTTDQWLPLATVRRLLEEDRMHNLRETSLEPHGFICICYGCSKRIEAKEPRFADLNGPPFVAYYCADCAVVRHPGPNR